jgi:peroxiredoxin
MKMLKLAATALSVAMLTANAWALKPGEAAPDFKGTDSHGRTQTLSQYRGKLVVLEWANRGCPYDRKHYESGNMEKLQQQWTAKGVVWLRVVSSAQGQDGYVTPAEDLAYLEKMHAAPTASILDPSGSIGRMYEAKTTPHIFVIDPQGKVVYEGAIDDQPTPDPASLKDVKHNYLNEALEATLAGKAVATPVTRPYGCNVKYGE